MPDIYERFLASAVRLINRYVPEPNVDWISTTEAGLADPNKPWLRSKPTEVIVSKRIYFLRDVLEDRQLLRYMRDTEVVDGQVNGIMYYEEGFEPKLKDSILIKSDQQLLTIDAVNPIPPAGLPIVIYDLEFGT